MALETKQKVEHIHEQMVMWRRHLHEHPELSFEEVETPLYIEKQLRKLGITDITTGVGGRGIVARIKGVKPGKTIAFRADFDALPIDEENDVSYASKVPGKMHACGHDGHTAALLGFAAIMKDQVEQLAGTIVLIFQHAEELPPGGAKEMIADGCLDDVDVIFGAHVSSHLPLGKVSCTPGAVMAAVDKFRIHIQGKGGHGAQPHTTLDSIVVGSQLVNELQTIVSRRVDPMAPAVVTVGVFQAGTAFNVIADTATIEGTVRTFDAGVRQKVEDELRAIVKGKEQSTHVTTDVDYLNGYPTLVNSEKESDIVRQLVTDVLGEKSAMMAPPILGGEDFAYYLTKKPGAFFHVGARTEEAYTQFPHHHPRFDFDEHALNHIASLFLALTNHYLIENEI
ncbi:M20 metallopeptidase family protein [Shouchella hunanensis]|uniref:Amidohydrolase n=1 Tax=Shouchella hunanensis TaxID=766894 RepID=A0ABY7W9N9_9BACI|nr:amidohydrolase [Shouchella hunanensis]WDF04273.1 amidohydrolase [Shouchella hunanensis]